MKVKIKCKLNENCCWTLKDLSESKLKLLCFIKLGAKRSSCETLATYQIWFDLKMDIKMRIKCPLTLVSVMGLSPNVTTGFRHPSSLPGC